MRHAAKTASALEGQGGPCLVPQLPAVDWSCISLQHMPVRRAAARVGHGHRQQAPKGDVPWEQGAASVPGVRGPAEDAVTVPPLPTQDWGMEMIYRHVKLPILCIKNFVVETPAEKRKYKKWSAVTFPVKEFDYVEHCSSTYGQSF